MLRVFLLHPSFHAIGVPALLLLAGATAKKLVRGSGWLRSDFFLGVEFSLAAMSAALVNLVQVARTIPRSGETPPGAQGQLIATAGFLVVAFFILLWVLAVHQDWERRDGQKGQFLRLGIFSNLAGSGLMSSFVLLVKGL